MSLSEDQSKPDHPLGEATNLSARGQGAQGGGFLEGFRLPQLEVRLSEMGGFDGIGASSQVGLLEEVPPAFVMIGRGLALLQILQS